MSCGYCRGFADVDCRICAGGATGRTWVVPVYVVTRGSYSDYRIERVFTDRALALAFEAEARRVTGWDGMVEVYPADEAFGESVPYWESWVDLATGEVREVSGPPRRWSDDGETGGQVEDGESRWWAAQVARGSPPKALRARSRVSQEHASKLAVELRQEALRVPGAFVTGLTAAGPIARTSPDPLG